jgi:hypothetical protein
VEEDIYYYSKFLQLHLRKNHGKTGPGREKADAARLMSQVQYKMALPGRMSLDPAHKLL